MANLYLIDKPFGENGLRLAAEDREAQVVLIQDGVYLDPSALLHEGRPVYALGADVAKRGLADRLPAGVKPLDYAGLVDLIFLHKVVNFA